MFTKLKKNVILLDNKLINCPMDKTNQKSNKGLVIALIILSVLFILSFATGAYFFVTSSNVLETFKIDNVDPSIANKLTGSIVYSSEREESANYFSPKLSLTFVYDETLLTVTEGGSYVNISPKDYSKFSYASLNTAKTTDVKGYILETSYLDELAVVSEDLEEDVKKVLFSYAKPSLVSDKSTTENVSLFYYVVDGQSVYVEIKGFDYTQDEEIENAITSLLGSVSFDVSDVEQDIKAQIGDTVTLTFDRSLWSISYQSEQSLSLVTADSSTGSMSIYVNPVYSASKVESAKALQGQVEEHFSNKGEYYKEKEYPFEMVGEIESMDISGVDFQYASYKYNYGQEPSTVETFYIGYLPGSELQVEITTRYTTDYKEVSELLGALVENIEVKDSEIYSSLNRYVLGTSTVSINPATVLGQSGTVRIFDEECNNVSFSSNLYPLGIAGKTYEVCSAGYGSGFVVNSNGDIVTNAHVADPNDLDVMLMGYSKDSSYEYAIYYDVVSVITAKYGASSLNYITEEEFESIVMSYIYNIYNQNLVTITPSSRELLVQGDSPFSFDANAMEMRNKEDHYVATLMGSNEITSSLESALDDSIGGADVADLALIHVDQEFNIPSMPITLEGIVTGQSIYVVGYPGLVDNNEIIDTSQLFSSTVTQGTISAIKANSNNTFELIQVDASVDHGNSGGPIIADDGTVIAVATYGIAPSSSGNYNAGVASSAIDEFLSSNNVTLDVSEERILLEEALEDVSKAYYSRAQEKFQTLVDNQSSLGVTIDPFIELCAAKVEAGEDKTPWLDLDMPLWSMILIPVLFVILVVMIIILIVLVKRNKKNKNIVG